MLCYQFLNDGWKKIHSKDFLFHLMWNTSSKCFFIVTLILCMFFFLLLSFLNAFLWHGISTQCILFFSFCELIQLCAAAMSEKLSTVKIQLSSFSNYFFQSVPFPTTSHSWSHNFWQLVRSDMCFFDTYLPNVIK